MTTSFLVAMQRTPDVDGLYMFYLPWLQHFGVLQYPTGTYWINKDGDAENNLDDILFDLVTEGTLTSRGMEYGRRAQIAIVDMRLLDADRDEKIKWAKDNFPLRYGYEWKVIDTDIDPSILMTTIDWPMPMFMKMYCTITFNGNDVAMFCADHLGSSWVGKHKIDLYFPQERDDLDFIHDYLSQFKVVPWNNLTAKEHASQAADVAWKSFLDEVKDLPKQLVPTVYRFNDGIDLVIEFKMVPDVFINKGASTIFPGYHSSVVVPFTVEFDENQIGHFTLPGIKDVHAHSQCFRSIIKDVSPDNPDAIAAKIGEEVAIACLRDGELREQLLTYKANPEDMVDGQMVKVDLVY